MTPQGSGISVVIPAYNRRAHVSHAIESVLSQTVPVGEIIVVDDGSSDGTGEATRSRFGSRVEVIVQENGGVSSARNTGIRAAQGEWIAFLDSDDVWFPTKTERQLQVLNRMGAGFGVCFTDNRFGGNPNMNRTSFEEAGFKPTAAEGDFDRPTRRLLSAREPFFTSSLLVLRRLLLDLGGFDQSLIVGEDADIVFRLSLCTRFCYVSDVLVEVDRTPSRSGLCDLYNTRDDRKYDSFERRYTKWLGMPQVIGSSYEEPIRQMLREFRFDSAEAKIHQLRFGSAARVLQRIAAAGEGYISIAANLLRRKAAKLLRRHRFQLPAAGAAVAGKEERAL
jgi:glycosyltransferase involved in cell wall biosynthesis